MKVMQLTGRRESDAIEGSRLEILHSGQTLLPKFLYVQRHYVATAGLFVVVTADGVDNLICGIRVFKLKDSYC
jgi:hypothetical protein